MERSAKEDDVKTCPLCGSREALVIRWLPDINHCVHEKTEVGCFKCEKFFSEKEDRHAIAAWNLFVVEEIERIGKKESHIELYRLLYEHSQAEKQAASLQTKIDNYLEENISPTCDLKRGDRFKVKEWPGGGIWSVEKVYSAYFWNTGPTWIIDAINVLTNGRLGEKHHEFLERDRAKIEPIKPFWPPTRWKQVIRGDNCLYSNQSGQILDVDNSKRIAKINLNGETIQVKSLSKLLLPIQRFEST
ncbi:MAG: hypothetical protein H8D67_14290 [Deltaproteobacteria bacterium]|nr:hypothetical protein [Deltaproteobacteria bacterium]